MKRNNCMCIVHQTLWFICLLYFSLFSCCINSSNNSCIWRTCSVNKKHTKDKRNGCEFFVKMCCAAFFIQTSQRLLHHFVHLHHCVIFQSYFVYLLNSSASCTLRPVSNFLSLSLSSPKSSITSFMFLSNLRASKM